MSEPVPEFSRIFSVARLSPHGTEETLDAKPEERKALAKRFDVVDISYLKATLTVDPKPQQAVLVKGTIQADVVQSCVVTLEPMVSHISIDASVMFVPFEQQSGEANASVDDDLDEDTETYAGGKLDLGEMVAQQLGVAIDPYPRKPDAKLTMTEFGRPPTTPHPFAKLADVVKAKDRKD